MTNTPLAATSPSSVVHRNIRCDQQLLERGQWSKRAEEPAAATVVWGNGHYAVADPARAGRSPVPAEARTDLVTPYSSTPIGTLDTPYWGIASNVGVPIQAEDFNQGGNGNGYFTTATSNAGGQYRTNENVGIETTT